MNRKSKTQTSCAVGVCLMMVATAAAQPFTVVYTEIPGHPTAAVPGVPGEEFTGLLELAGSPSGNHWIFKGFTTAVSAANDVMVAGSGDTGVTVAKEGDAAPVDGLTYGFMDSDCGINDSGLYAFGNRLSGGPTTTDEVIFVYNGEGLVAAAREGDPAPGLTDNPPGAAGDELFGNSLNSAHVLADGTVAFRADLIQNIATAFRSALYHGSAVQAQEGTMIDGFTIDSFAALAGNTFSSDPTGLHWIVEADTDPSALNNTESVVVDGVLQFRDGDILPGLGSGVTDIFGVNMAGNGDWFARGESAVDVGWVIRNGVVLATLADPITPGSFEVFVTPATGTTFFTARGHRYGDYLIGGLTNADPTTDAVLVLNGLRVVAREGDAVDLDGNGMADDDAFINSFNADSAFVDDWRVLHLFVTLRNGAGTSLGDAFLREDVHVPGDDDGDGDVDLPDYANVADCLSGPGGGPVAPACRFLDLDQNSDVDLADAGAWFNLFAP